MVVNHIDAAPAKPRGSAPGKRKTAEPIEDYHLNVGARKCYYCGGVFNFMYNIGSHVNDDCPEMEFDRSDRYKVRRRNFWTHPSKRAWNTMHH